MVGRHWRWHRRRRMMPLLHGQRRHHLAVIRLRLTVNVRGGGGGRRLGMLVIWLVWLSIVRLLHGREGGVWLRVRLVVLWKWLMLAVWVPNGIRRLPIRGHGLQQDGCKPTAAIGFAHARGGHRRKKQLFGLPLNPPAAHELPDGGDDEKHHD